MARNTNGQERLVALTTALTSMPEVRMPMTTPLLTTRLCSTSCAGSPLASDETMSKPVPGSWCLWSWSIVIIGAAREPISALAWCSTWHRRQASASVVYI